MQNKEHNQQKSGNKQTRPERYPGVSGLRLPYRICAYCRL